MARSSVVAVAIGVMALIGGCGHKDGDRFIGKWGREGRKGTVEIARNGEGFLVSDTHADFITGGMKTDKIPATYHDGVLQVSTGFGTSNIGYDKEHDTLLMPTMGGSAELSRLKQ
ncbi:hypothetical protein [Ralstonia sp. Ralssp110]|uniref:hypothetical protein n=1 Tax=Ralstonia sp. Ralssp110 TaxID=3243004 RepID=UPI0039B3D8BB